MMAAPTSRPLPAEPPAPPQHQFPPLAPQQSYQQYQQQQPPLPPPPPEHQQQQQQRQRQPSYPQPFPQLQSSQSQSQLRQSQSQAQAQSQPQRGAAQEKARPKSRAFSFRSDKSQKSSGSHARKASGSQPHNLSETHAEKEAKRLHSKADPTLAMNELEPAAVAATGESSLGSIRDMPHKDIFGNPISVPDKSNPTRYRWERPLDTIRSFEAAIDSAYSRKSFIRPDSAGGPNFNRRSSYYSYNGAAVGARYPQDSFYGGRRDSYMPPSGYYDGRQGTPAARDSYYFDQQQGMNGQSNAGPSNPRQRYSRMASEPQFNTAYRQGEQSVYPLPGNQKSYETVASGAGSGSSAEPAGYQTDPTSSDNSSIERVQSPPKRPEPVNDYGIGFSQPSAFTVGLNSSAGKAPANNGAPRQSINQPLPPVPRRESTSILRKPLKQPVVEMVQEKPAAAEKRKSWFARRFSKQSN